ncbi:hypothetical protein QJS10_CPA10g00861 [Acorus calamus]|uniref:DUF632 domain-containing protein n=1 Tax=Acorus calamus TaxID=4465 RepID=A0AAV9E0Y7_ACOCL|nr:hypothetical protein QJS10_CPA10g00861 [Acorus calamus]
MGCNQSKIDEEEAVMRCKDRKTHMRLAVSARNAFSAVHSAYTVSLKHTGSALIEYGQGEVLLDPAYHPPSITSSVSSSSAAAAAAAAVIHHPQPPLENLRPPPPLPNFSPLQRSVSMPDLPVPKPAPRSDPAETIQEEEDEEEEAAAATTAAELSPRTPPPPPRPSEPLPQQTSSPLPPPSPPPPQEQSRWDYFFENIPGPTLAEPETPTPPPEMPEKVVVEPPPPPPEQVAVKPLKKKKQSNSNTVHHQHAASTSAAVASVEGGKRGKAMVMSSVSLIQIMKDLDEHFLKGYESAHEVSNMLEANRLHYHSNFADNRGHIDHSAKVMRVITWNRSFRGIPNTDEGKDDFDSDESETHATVLDKLLAWEKKLYDEVKAGELMKIEYQKKVALLNKQKKRNTNPENWKKPKQQ